MAIRVSGHNCLMACPSKWAQGVTHDLQPFLILDGDDGQIGILGNHLASIHQFTIDSTGDAGLGGPGPMSIATSMTETVGKIGVGYHREA